MKRINNYITEKFKISKDIDNSSSINEKQFDLRFEGLTIGDFFKWYEDENLDDKLLGQESFIDFFDSSNILQVYFNDNEIESHYDITSKDFDKVIKLFISHKNDKIILYQMAKKAKVNTYCEFEVDFLNEPIGFECSTEYNGKYKEKYEL